ncbi:MAG: cytochrome c oxidase subunit 3, partial [Verrucomicrobiae bacterium]|nr:cytochrome c oxidase subunit 3 [Verrucomicrobiae bacterium]
ALISAFMIVKAGNVMWPPPGQPRLPIELTAINTLFLVASAVTIYLSNKSLNAGNEAKSIKQLGLTIILGGTFLAIQGFEWIRMLSFGLTFTSSNYGSFFYMIIGSHGLHVVGGMLVLINVFLKFAKGNLLKPRFWGAQTFWYFVVGVWPVLYVLVYLS